MKKIITLIIFLATCFFVRGQEQFTITTSHSGSGSIWVDHHLVDDGETIFVEISSGGACDAIQMVLLDSSVYAQNCGRWLSFHITVHSNLHIHADFIPQNDWPTTVTRTGQPNAGTDTLFVPCSGIFPIDLTSDSNYVLTFLTDNGWNAISYLQGNIYPLDGATGISHEILAGYTPQDSAFTITITGSPDFFDEDALNPYGEIKVAPGSDLAITAWEKYSDNWSYWRRYVDGILVDWDDPMITNCDYGHMPDSIFFDIGGDCDTYTFHNITADHTIYYEYVWVPGVNENQAQHPSAYPNPATEFFSIQYKAPEEIRNIELYDPSGRRLLSQANGNTINISHLKNGLYFCVIHFNNNTKFVAKVLKISGGNN